MFRLRTWHVLASHASPQVAVRTCNTKAQEILALYGIYKVQD